MVAAVGPLPVLPGRGLGSAAVTDDPIRLDGRRTPAGMIETELRRRPANIHSMPGRAGRSHTAGLDAQMLAEPARTWIDVMEKWRFLLESYAATPDAREEGLQTLIGRALGDMARLKSRENRNP